MRTPCTTSVSYAFSRSRSRRVPASRARARAASTSVSENSLVARARGASFPFVVPPRAPSRLRVSASAVATDQNIIARSARSTDARASSRTPRARHSKKCPLARIASAGVVPGRVASRRRRRRRAPFDRIACIISHRPPRSISARWQLRTRRTPLASVSELARRCDEVVGPNACPTSRTVARRRRRRRSRATIGARALARVSETAARPSARRRRPRRRRRARRARRRARGARRRRRVRRTVEAATRARGGASSVAVRKRNGRRRGVVVERRMIDGAGSRVPLGWRRSPRARRDGQPPRAFPRRAPARTT